MKESIFTKNSINAIVSQIKEKHITPNDLIDAVTVQTRMYNNDFGAFVNFDEETLYSAAEKFSYRDDYILPGIPIGVKDVMNTTEYPTEMGSTIWKGFLPGNDARIVYELKHNGALVAGKTATAEFAVHTLNETYNPHDITKTPGTSSSGSAVAVSLGMIPSALGTQTAGSIVRPASFCGVFGCKPSYGLIPRTGVLKTTDTLDNIGFFTYCAEDLRLIFDAVRVRGNDYPLSNFALNDRARQMKKSDKWRVALLKTYTWQDAEDYAKEELLQFVESIASKAGSYVEITEADLSCDLFGAHDTHNTIYNKCLSYYFQKEYNDLELVSHGMREMIESGKEITPVQYQNALNKQILIQDQFERFFDDFDVIISLSTAGEAPLRSITEKPDNALILSLAHLPMVSVPQFRSPNKLPFGVLLAARKYSDYKLFSFIDFLIEQELIPKFSTSVERV